MFKSGVISTLYCTRATL